MLLSLHHGECFATGGIRYDYLPTSGGSTERIYLRVEIGGYTTSAMLDTGAPYFICSPEIIQSVGCDPNDSIPTPEILIRGANRKGRLQRLSLTLIATEGQSLSIDALAFIPSQDEVDFGSNFPSFLGMCGCLERLRFAVDPVTQTFYFGQCP